MAASTRVKLNQSDRNAIKTKRSAPALRQDAGSRSASAHPSFVSVLRKQGQDRPDKVAFRFLADGEAEGECLSYAQLDRQARAIGAMLQASTKRDMRAVLLYPPGLGFVSAFFGCLYAGVVPVPVYPPNLGRPERTLPKLLSIMSNAQPSVVLTSRPVETVMSGLFSKLPALSPMRWLVTDNVADDLGDSWRDLNARTDTLAFLQYTSGSTAQPKGVMLTHGNLLHNTALIERALHASSDTVGVSWLPLFHDMGLIGHILQTVYSGGACVLMAPLDFLLRPHRWLRAISKYRATISGGPNFAYDLCVAKASEELLATLDLSSWRLAFTGAEPVRFETIDRFARTFEPCGFRQASFYPCYGLAEATLMVSGGLPERLPKVEKLENRPGDRRGVTEIGNNGNGHRALVGCGGTLPGQQIAIVDPESLARCEAGEIGEIWVRGASVAQGYWLSKEESEQKFRAFIQNTGEGPFLRTGDLGFLKDGELFVVSRLKDLIIIRGRNFYPEDIEQTAEASRRELRLGCCAAFSTDIDGEERLVLVAEVERRSQTERRQKKVQLPEGLQRRAPNDRREELALFVQASPSIRPSPKPTSSIEATDQALNFEAIGFAIRQSVWQKHEVLLHTLILVKAGSIPKTSSGKIQRHACRAGFLAETLDILWSSSTLCDVPV